MENLLDLPEAIIEEVLYYTSRDLRTIAQVAQVCKAFKRTAYSDKLWLKICTACFTETDPTLWIAQGSPRNAGIRSLQAPTNYRCCSFEGKTLFFPEVCLDLFYSNNNALRIALIKHAVVLQMCVPPAVFLCIHCGLVEGQWQCCQEHVV